METEQQVLDTSQETEVPISNQKQIKKSQIKVRVGNNCISQVLRWVAYLGSFRDPWGSQTLEWLSGAQFSRDSSVPSARSQLSLSFKERMDWASSLLPPS